MTDYVPSDRELRLFIAGVAAARDRLNEAVQQATTDYAAARFAQATSALMDGVADAGQMLSEGAGQGTPDRARVPRPSRPQQARNKRKAQQQARKKQRKR